jgi:hypothetical protein
MTTIGIETTCDARVGYAAGEWHETPIWCSATVGLTAYRDDHGITRHYCRHHRTFVEHRYPPLREPDACRWCGDTAAIVDGRYILLDVQGRLEVCCDDCYAKADEPDDEPPEFDREGQPEFNGAFR